MENTNNTTTNTTKWYSYTAKGQHPLSATPNRDTASLQSFVIPEEEDDGMSPDERMNWDIRGPFSSEASALRSTGLVVD